MSPLRVFITLEHLSLIQCRVNQGKYNKDIMQYKSNKFCYIELIVVWRML